MLIGTEISLSKLMLAEVTVTTTFKKELPKAFVQSNIIIIISIFTLFYSLGFFLK